jgi:hypothetical protein
MLESLIQILKVELVVTFALGTAKVCPVEAPVLTVTKIA